MRILLTLPLLVDCTGGDTDTDTGEIPCADRTGGAEVTLEVTGESFTLWSEDDAFIDEAIVHRDDDTSRVAFFLNVLEEPDCDDQWTFHVGSSMEWADLATEVCDGRPSDVEADLSYWIDNVQSWCPWGPVVTAVDDRR